MMWYPYYDILIHDSICLTVVQSWHSQKSNSNYTCPIILKHTNDLNVPVHIFIKILFMKCIKKMQFNNHFFNVLSTDLSNRITKLPGSNYHLHLEHIASGNTGVDQLL